MSLLWFSVGVEAMKEKPKPQLERERRAKALYRRQGYMLAMNDVLGRIKGWRSFYKRMDDGKHSATFEDGARAARVWAADDIEQSVAKLLDEKRWRKNG